MLVRLQTSVTDEKWGTMSQSLQPGGIRAGSFDLQAIFLLWGTIFTEEHFETMGRCIRTHIQRPVSQVDIFVFISQRRLSGRISVPSEGAKQVLHKSSHREYLREKDNLPFLTVFRCLWGYVFGWLKRVGEQDYYTERTVGPSGWSCSAVYENSTTRLVSETALLRESMEASLGILTQDLWLST